MESKSKNPEMDMEYGNRRNSEGSLEKQSQREGMLLPLNTEGRATPLNKVCRRLLEVKKM